MSAKESSSLVFKKTYEMHPNPPAPMSWETYSTRVLAEWKVLLDSQAGCDEKLIHQFLVQHPSMIPGAYSVSGPSGHGPFPFAVLSESPLCANGMKVPDFIWLAKDSMNFTPVFVEIESPCKRWFTKQGVPTHDLAQAMNQIAEWHAWLNRHENLAVFFEAFEIPDYMRRDLTFRPEFVLIYGRRKEFEERPELTRLRAQFERHGQIVMTFDRLSPDRNAGIFMSATKRNKGYQALAFPTTMKLGPNSNIWLTQIHGVSESILKNEWIDPDRRDFLIERIPYWAEWARNRCNSITAGETE